MTTNSDLNLHFIRKIALALKELNKRVVFVGGAVVGCYNNYPSAEDVRPTNDIDISLEISTLMELENVRLELKAKGFIQSAEDKVMCRFRYEDIIVDVLSTKEIGWAPANPWFAPGFQHIQKYHIPKYHTPLQSHTP